MKKVKSWKGGKVGRQTVKKKTSKPKNDKVKSPREQKFELKSQWVSKKQPAKGEKCKKGQSKKVKNANKYGHSKEAKFEVFWVSIMKVIFMASAGKLW